MKRLAIVALLCLVSPCFASIALVQSNAGTSTSTGSCTSPSCSITTGPAFYSSPTTAGNLLVLVAWARTTSGTFAEPPLILANTSGFTWTSADFSQWFQVGQLEAGISVVYYIQNAASMSVGTTVNALTAGSGHTMSMNVEFTLYEFSGVATASALDKHAQRFSTGIPGTANLPTTTTDLVVVAYSGVVGSNLTAGSGYTLGTNAIVSVLGQTQYSLNVASGSIATSFGGSVGTYGATAAAFKSASPGSGGVVRHKGYVF